MFLKPNFNGTPLFEVEYFINGTRYRHDYHRILIGTNTRPTHGCKILMTLNNFECQQYFQRHEASRGLSATMSFLFFYEWYLDFLILHNCYNYYMVCQMCEKRVQNKN